jgi:hypothetical protein
MIEVTSNAGELTEADAIRLLQEVSLLVGDIFKEYLGYPLPTFGNLAKIFRNESHEVGSPEVILISLGLQRFFHARITAQKRSGTSTSWRLSLQTDPVMAIGPNPNSEFPILKADAIATIFTRIAKKLSTQHPDYDIHYNNDYSQTYAVYRHGEPVAQPAKPTKGKP